LCETSLRMTKNGQPLCRPKHEYRSPLATTTSSLIRKSGITSDGPNINDKSAYPRDGLEGGTSCGAMLQHIGARSSSTRKRQSITRVVIHHSTWRLRSLSRPVRIFDSRLLLAMNCQRDHTPGKDTDSFRRTQEADVPSRLLQLLRPCTICMAVLFAFAIYLRRHDYHRC
jgi:hypothetical protein